MAITKRAPNTIHLGGPIEYINHLAAGVVIKPGMTIEMYSDGGVQKLRPVASATAVSGVMVALEQDLMNLTVDDSYAIGDLVIAGRLTSGSTFWALINSGENIVNSDYLQNNGDGRLKEATSTASSANVARFQASETVGAVMVETRVRVEVL